jgi:hypothetical protein
MKPAGHGWEVGFEHHGAPLFVGNFVYQPEATAWFKIMKKEISKFSKRYPVGKTFPVRWYQKFISDYLYKCYYYYLDRVFAKHTRTFTTKFNKEFGTYRKLSRKWTPTEKHPALKRAA